MPLAWPQLVWCPDHRRPLANAVCVYIRFPIFLLIGVSRAYPRGIDDCLVATIVERIGRQVGFLQHGHDPISCIECAASWVFALLPLHYWGVDQINQRTPELRQQP